MYSHGLLVGKQDTKCLVEIRCLGERGCYKGAETQPRLRQ
jgi:hypothetical protein